MTSEYTRFTSVVNDLAPRSAIVFGSGLSNAASEFRESDAIGFEKIPGLVAPSIRGHSGKLAVGLWSETPVLIFFGRLHFYEGHGWDLVTRPVRVAAELGVKLLILTNAVGGIHPALHPGNLMVIREHIVLSGHEAWRSLAQKASLFDQYSQQANDWMLAHEAVAGRGLLGGRFAALTGPCYETPAEIRALRECGADCVGMSTAREAEAAVTVGLSVAAISCVTNRAAGLGDGKLDHAEVVRNAKLGVDQLGKLLVALVRSQKIDTLCA